ncbi:GerW family sporulation protein [Clostridium akagii]|uniref:GerW family sporulation protein n=1 Tax=Clostridium akagii TaxID=91623 RepID=UPI00047E398A|nr:GerW family sporulation protein [Clostridium akagii]
MENHPIETLMTSTMENIRDMIDVNTIIGDPIESKDGTLILPISKVSFGFASGGTEFSNIKHNENKESKENKTDKFPFGGGSGAGVSVKPVAFLVIRPDSVRLLSVDSHNSYEKMIDTLPQIMELIKDSLEKHNTQPDTTNKDEVKNAAEKFKTD